MASRPQKRPLKLVEAVLLGSGVTLLALYGAGKAHSVIGRAQALQAFERVEASSPPARDASPPERGSLAARDAYMPAEDASQPAPDTSLWAASRIAAYQKSIAAADDLPLGVLRIPNVDLEVPVFDGTSEFALNRGIGLIEGTAQLGSRSNVGLAGHRDGFFRALKDVAVGDVIEVRTLDATLRYRVVDLSVVEPTDVYVLDPTPDAVLTLVTCYPFYYVGDAPQRYIVRAVIE